MIYWDFHTSEAISRVYREGSRTERIYSKWQLRGTKCCQHGKLVRDHSGSSNSKITLVIEVCHKFQFKENIVVDIVFLVN